MLPVTGNNLAIISNQQHESAQNYQLVFFLIKTLIIFNSILFISSNVHCQINAYCLILCIISKITCSFVNYQLKVLKISNNIDESAEWLYFDLVASIMNCLAVSKMQTHKE